MRALRLVAIWYCVWTVGPGLAVMLAGIAQ